VLALATAWSFLAGEPSTGAKVRVIVIALALATVLADWWLAKRVEQLRAERSRTSDAVLMSAAPSAEEIRQADAARAAFGQWHTYSLLMSFVTLILVTVAMGMTAGLPAGKTEAPAGPVSEAT
jgi:hypothetical protein